MASAPPVAALTLDSVSVSFQPGVPVLEAVELSVVAGEFVSLVGPSGCGKSTILRLLAGLLQPTSGQVVRGEDLAVAFVFQEPNLLPWRSVVGNVGLPLELAGLPADEQARRVDECLELVGLSQLDRPKRPQELSGGMRMRVSLARALATRPDVLLLDEPFAALDDMLRGQLNEDLLKIHAARGVTTLFVTHNVAEAVFLSERVLVMSTGPGRLVAEFAVPFGYPRDPSLRAEAAFARLAGQVSGQLRERDS